LVAYNYTEFTVITIVRTCTV